MFSAVYVEAVSFSLGVLNYSIHFGFTFHILRLVIKTYSYSSSDLKGGGGGAILSPADFDLSTRVLILNFKTKSVNDNTMAQDPPPPLFSLTIYTTTERTQMLTTFVIQNSLHSI